MNDTYILYPPATIPVHIESIATFGKRISPFYDSTYLNNRFTHTPIKKPKQTIMLSWAHVRVTC